MRLILRISTLWRDRTKSALSLEQCLLEPHDLRSVGLTILGIIALYCAIINIGSNFLSLIALAIKMTGFASFAIAKPVCGTILTDLICIN